MRTPRPLIGPFSSFCVISPTLPLLPFLLFIIPFLLFPFHSIVVIWLKIRRSRTQQPFRRYEDFARSAKLPPETRKARSRTPSRCPPGIASQIHTSSFQCGIPSFKILKLHVNCRKCKWVDHEWMRCMY